MSCYFPNCTIPAQSIKIRKRIKEAIEIYRKNKLPGRILLTDNYDETML